MCFTGISPTVVVQRQLVYLTCPGRVESPVKWSRERDGERVDLITAKDDHWIKHKDDPSGRYYSSPDNSLIIKNAVVSDSGTYYCNDEPAARLTVILSGNIRLYQSCCEISTWASLAVFNLCL